MTDARINVYTYTCIILQGVHFAVAVPKGSLHFTQHGSWRWRLWTWTCFCFIFINCDKNWSICCVRVGDCSKRENIYNFFSSNASWFHFTFWLKVHALRFIVVFILDISVISPIKVHVSVFCSQKKIIQTLKLDHLHNSTLVAYLHFMLGYEFREII